MRAFVLLLLLCCAGPAVCKGPEVGKPAPTIKATLLDGSAFDLAAMSGKVVVVHFWATWCSPCRTEMPAFEAFYQAHKSEGLVVVAITLDTHEDLSKINAVMRDFSYPAALLENTQAKGYGRIWRVPLTFVIDRHGVLRRDGFATKAPIDDALLDHDVLPLLREQ
ncbi:MAG TPA: TlpA disulfide reductase family protein [Xanthomonadaceae bacterium]|nr:TlpA disulfide reductase family protein [Xanthomonadaceae bacterium]